MNNQDDTQKNSRGDGAYGLLDKVRGNFAAVSLCALSSVFAIQASAASCVPEREAYIAIDAASGQVLLAQDSDVKIQPASMTKMMTLLLAHEAMDQGLIAEDARIVISQNTLKRKDMEHVSGWRGAIKFEDALTATAVKSYNDLAVTIAENVAKAYGAGSTETHFVSLMNKKAEDIGMKDTVFYNATGLPNPLIKSNEKGSTTHDMAILLKYIADNHADLLDTLGTSEATVKQRKIRSTNSLLHKTDSPVENVAGKTGYTCKAGFALTATMAEAGQNMIISYVGAKNAVEREARILHIADKASAKSVEAAVEVKAADALEPQDPAQPVL